MMRGVQFYYAPEESQAYYYEETESTASSIFIDINNNLAFKLTMSIEKKNSSQKKVLPMALISFGELVWNGYKVYDFYNDFINPYLDHVNRMSFFYDLLHTTEIRLQNAKKSIDRLTNLKNKICPNGNNALSNNMKNALQLDINRLTNKYNSAVEKAFDFLHAHNRDLLIMAGLTVGQSAISFVGKKQLDKILSNSNLANSGIGRWIQRFVPQYYKKEIQQKIAESFLSNSMGFVYDELVLESPGVIFNPQQTYDDVENSFLGYIGDLELDIINEANVLMDIAKQSSHCPIDDDDDDDRRKKRRWHPKEKIPQEDPSGYVYEAVPTNRLEGVNATVFYRENNKPALWNAKEFGQINPQITDEMGLYAWDVPQGMWQVRYEKEGYETQQTDWLPVPPPQLEINIPMQQAIAPIVTNARGAESGIWLTFSKYMKPETLTKSGRVSATCNGKTVKGEVEMLNLEEDPYNKHEYASKVKFVPDVAFNTTDEVIITVKKEVESYASMPMEEDFVQRIAIEPEIKEIVCDSLIVVDYQNAATIEITVAPASASKGKVLHVESTSPMIASVDRTEVTLDDEGKAHITVSGNLPGGAALLLSLPEAELTVAPQVQVVIHENVVRKPKASKRTGSVVEEGFLLTLTSATPGAIIYYTTDGSCPCDEQTRLRYDAPIVITKDMTINAIAVREGMEDSEVATFTYRVGDPLGVSLAEVNKDIDIEYENGAFIITGAEGATCHVYDLAGQLVARKLRIARRERMPFSRKGTYVVNVETVDGVTYAKKVVVR